MSAKQAKAVKVANLLKAAAKKHMRPGDNPSLAYLYVQRRYAFERFLARISRTQMAGRWMLKGGVLLLAIQERRATQDIDLSIRSGPTDLDGVIGAIREIAAADPVEEDGLEFRVDTSDGKAARIIGEQVGTPTVRIPMVAVLMLPREVPVSFVVDATAAEMEHTLVMRPFPPTLAGFEPTVAASSSWELVAAEKLHTVLTGTYQNPRLRDYMDLIALSRAGLLDMEKTAGEVARVFAARGTEPGTDVVGLSGEFAAGRQRDWTGTLKTSGYGTAVPASLADAIDEVGTLARQLVGLAMAASPGIPEASRQPGMIG